MQRLRMQVTAPPMVAAGFFVTFAQSSEPATPSVGLVAKADFEVQPDGGLRVASTVPRLSGDRWAGERFAPNDPFAECVYPTDFSPPKPHPEIIVVGACVSPKPVTMLPVRVMLGRWSKTVYVFGDRTWVTGLLRTKPSEPQPFTSMPLSWTNAIGGTRGATNPVGRPAASDPLPNLELPTALIASPHDHPPPANFGPINTQWPDRQTRMGTYDRDWLATRWPGPPADFDPEFFNAAPADQWLPTPLVGNEPLEFDFLHPHTPRWIGTLPGWRVTAQIQRIDANSPDDVPMTLDTVFFDTTTHRLSLTWHGIAPVADDFLGDVRGMSFSLESCAGANESPAVPIPAGMAPVQSPEPVRAGQPTPNWHHLLRHHPIMAELDAPSDADRRVAAWFAEAEALERGALETRAPLAARDVAGVVSHVRAVLTRVRENDRTLGEADLAADLDAEMACFSRTGRFAPYLAQAPAAAADSAWTRPAIVARLAAGESFAQLDLRGVDISDLDFSNVDLRDALLTGATLRHTNFSRANLRGAVLSAVMAPNAQFTAADLTGADFTTADLIGADFSHATLDATDFSQATLDGATIAHATGRDGLFLHVSAVGLIAMGCHLPASTWTDATLADANFDDATLSGATWERVRAPRLSARQAVVGDLRAGEGADFTDAQFPGLSGDGSIWTDSTLNGASFRAAELARADFSRARLACTNFAAANLPNARLLQVVLTDATFSDANCLRANFDGAEFAGATFSDANCFEAEFFNATATDQANWAGCQLAGSKLALS